MPFYYYFLLFIMLSIIFLVCRPLFLRKRNISVELFSRALRNENSGLFEEAVIDYECALQEVKKIKFHKKLKNKIIDKLRVLHTFIEYKNNMTIQTESKGNWNETEGKATDGSEKI